MTYAEVRKVVKKNAQAKRAKVNAWFFKTGKGEYGYGDQFIGLTVPIQRKIARQFKDLNRKELSKLLKSKIHEERLIGLFILVGQYQKTKDVAERKKIYSYYLKHWKSVNNWDLVDCSTHKIMGHYIFHHARSQRALLYKWAKSKNLWQRRMSIMATFYFISQKEFSETLKISQMLLKDEHDLIHKASGWMLREVGKKNLATEEKFLKKHYKSMPRTMLRYAIEKLPEKRRKAYLQGKV